MWIVIAIALGILPSVIWLIFFDREDHKHPEAIKDIIYGFILGALATFVALLIQIVLNKFFLGSGIATRSPLAVTAFATIEELVKFLAVFMIVRVRRNFDEPLDAMIYMITVALGFAAVENVASVINHGNLLQGVVIVKSLETVVLRFLGATLLHSVTSAIVGFHWAVGIISKKNIGWHIAAGLVVASALHAMFNYLIIRTGPTSWAIVFAATIAFFVLIDFEKVKTEDI